MSIKKFLKTKPQIYSVLFFLLKSINYFNKQFHNSYKNYTPTSRWKLRTELVISSPDNAKIHKNDNAGKIYNRYQMMHNGLKINLGSYYNVENAVSYWLDFADQVGVRKEVSDEIESFLAKNIS